MKWLILMLLWAGTIFVDGWIRWPLGLAAVVSTYFVGGLWWYRNASPWRQVYVRAIGAYTPIGTVHSELARSRGVDFDPETTFDILLEHLYPDWSAEARAAVLANYRRRAAAGEYENEWLRFLHEKFAHLTPEKRIVLSAEQLASSDKALRVRSLIADLIEREHGTEQREAFWRALFAGEVQ
jgi:hypothetical protein